ncbi:Retrovirus-related Pol polyprotein like [Argiope bruennichi]|uniref:Retrovirus-related Pol polyprotein like n=1 Tax=Argiope bruennichi TaxID=94029 RepID=A0A8T0F4F6_ARGBR|nr:Retrovirus-related Pol polyprotein like [Argiope bruennichi]
MGFGEPGVVKAKCAKCNPVVQGDRTQPPTLNHMNFYSILMESQPSSIIEINDFWFPTSRGVSTLELHIRVFRRKTLPFPQEYNGRRFENSTVDMALEDGHVQKTDILLQTTVDRVWQEKLSPRTYSLEKFQRGKPNSSGRVLNHVASDHQPFRWALNFKVSDGRLARWALEIQAFNLKVLYVAGKANVVADMLSRPVCDEKETPFEVCNKPC